MYRSTATENIFMSGYKITTDPIIKQVSIFRHLPSPKMLLPVKCCNKNVDTRTAIQYGIQKC